YFLSSLMLWSLIAGPAEAGHYRCVDGSAEFEQACPLHAARITYARIGALIEPVPNSRAMSAATAAVTASGVGPPRSRISFTLGVPWTKPIATSVAESANA